MTDGRWRWALVSPDGVAPSRVVGVSASVNLSLHHKVQKFSSGPGSPGWSRKNGHKTVAVKRLWFVCMHTIAQFCIFYFLWPPCGIGQAIIFLPCGFFISSIFFPRLISASTDRMPTILPHMVWPYCEFRMQV